MASSQRGFFASLTGAFMSTANHTVHKTLRKVNQVVASMAQANKPGEVLFGGTRPYPAIPATMGEDEIFSIEDLDVELRVIRLPADPHELPNVVPFSPPFLAETEAQGAAPPLTSPSPALGETTKAAEGGEAVQGEMASEVTMISELEEALRTSDDEDGRQPASEASRVEEEILNPYLLRTSGHLLVSRCELSFSSRVPGRDMSIPYALIKDVELPARVDDTAPATLRLDLYNYVHVAIVVPRGSQAVLLFESIARATFSQCRVPRCLSLREAGADAAAAAAAPGSAGWAVYDPCKVFEAMGVDGAFWRRCDVNKDYAVCPTYPEVTFVPHSITDDVVRRSAAFRSKGRFPMLSYLHTNKSSIARCAQPMKGLLNVRSPEDEELVRAMFVANQNLQPEAKYYIIDARPMVNAVANIAGGKGYETAAHYGKRCEVVFLNIQNIHEMRASLRSLLAILCDPRMLACLQACRAQDCLLTEQTSRPVIDHVIWNRFFTSVTQTLWFEHLKAIIRGVVMVASCVHTNGDSVLVHCSDGWDRTAQLTSLSQLLLSPASRTIEGYLVLIEKEWASCGHQFALRYGFQRKTPSDSNEISPIFTQFLDCTWQIMVHHVKEFEFTERLLLDIHAALVSQQHGTLYGNCQKDRAHLRHRSTSAWDDILSRRQSYLNPDYAPTQGLELLPHSPDLTPRLWVSMYSTVALE